MKTVVGFLLSVTVLFSAVTSYASNHYGGMTAELTQMHLAEDFPYKSIANYTRATITVDFAHKVIYLSMTGAIPGNCPADVVCSSPAVEFGINLQLIDIQETGCGKVYVARTDGRFGQGTSETFRVYDYSQAPACRVPATTVVEYFYKGNPNELHSSRSLFYGEQLVPYIH